MNARTQFETSLVASGELTTLAAVAAALAAPRGAIEAGFLAVGERLGECAGALRSLGGDFEALMADFRSSDLAETAAGLARLGTEAAAMAGSFGGEREAIGRLAAALGAAASPIDDLQRAVRTIGIVSVNARVVAAGAIEEGNGLEVFTTDIAELSLAANEAVGTLLELFDKLSEETRRAESQRAGFETAHLGTLGSLGARIDLRLAAVRQRRAEAAQASAGASEASNGIAARVAEAIFALQVGDNTRQRVEHVETGLAMLEGHMPGWPQEAAHAACRLLAAQLGAAADALSQEADAAEAALSGLAGDAAGMADEGKRMTGAGGSGEGETPLAALSAELRFVGALLRECESERGKLDTVAVEVGAAVKALCDHVGTLQTIEANMRLLSLNATVKCAQMGARGRALNVIAQQLRELTASTETAAERTIACLNDAAGRAEAIAGASRGDSAGAVGRLEEEASRAVGLLEGVDARLNAAAGRLETTGRRVSDILGEAARTLSQQAATAALLRQAQDGILANAPTAGGPAPQAAPFFAEARALYTMEAERTLHDAIEAELDQAA